MQSFVHDPQAVLDYVIDWSTYLGADTIMSCTWDITGPDAVLIKDNDSHTDTTATIWLSGGTANRDYTVTCHIETGLGREDDRSIMIQVRQQ